MAANIERHEIEPLFDGAANDLFSVRPDWLAAGCGWMWHSVALTWDFLA